MNRYDALKHAVKAHGSTLDKCGNLYVLHPIAVAEAIEASGEFGVRENLIVVALLHDVWEDTDYPLAEGDLSTVQRSALLALTRHPDETFADYIERVCRNSIASIIKLADLYHNLSPERQACLPEKERRGLEKRYLKARDRIWEALGYRWWPEPLEGEQ